MVVYFRSILEGTKGQAVNMNIWIWGTGEIAEKILENGFDKKIEGFIETKKTKETFKGYPVINAKDIPQTFDCIFVANRFVRQIHDWCVEAGLDMQKIIFLIKGEDKAYYQKLSPALKEILGEKNYLEYQGEYGIVADTFFEEDKKRYQELNFRSNFDIKEENLWPIIRDKYASAGLVNNYFWQDLWGAQHIISDRVSQHYDIGSRLDGFIAHLLAAGIDVHMIDIRPFPCKIDHLYTTVDDATMMKNVADNSLSSLSALCSLEHFGVGRYGDQVDPEACFKCFEQIQKKLKSGGRFYLSVPVGNERVEFNAHRVFFASTILDCFRELTLEEFSCTANGEIEYNVDIHKYDDDMHNGEYRYGLFYFKKK